MLNTLQVTLHPHHNRFLQFEFEADNSGKNLMSLPLAFELSGILVAVHKIRLGSTLLSTVKLWQCHVFSWKSPMAVALPGRSHANFVYDVELRILGQY